MSEVALQSENAGFNEAGLELVKADLIILARSLSAPVVVADSGSGSINETLAAFSYATTGDVADLLAFAALSTTGLVVRTGEAGYTTRAVTGTANEITVTNGDGVAGAPTVSLPAAITLTGKTLTGGTFVGPTLTSPTTDTLTITSTTDSTNTSTGALICAGGAGFAKQVSAQNYLATMGTITSAEPVFDSTVTWNSGATTFDAIKLNVTNTASAVASRLLNLQVGGSSVFTFTRGGLSTQVATTTDTVSTVFMRTATLTASPASGTSNTYIGEYTVVNTGASTVNNLTGTLKGHLIATTYGGTQTGSGTLTSIYGLDVQAVVDTSSASAGKTLTVTSIRGINVQPLVYSTTGTTSAVTNYYGLYLDSAELTGAGTETITNNWGVYQADVNAKNFFAGTTDSTSTSTGALIISGGVGIAKSVYIGEDLTVTTTSGTAITLGAASNTSSAIVTSLGTLLRHRKYGYAVTPYTAAQLGDSTRGVALGIDVGTIAGGQFTGTYVDVLMARGVQFRVPNAGATDWETPIRIDGGGSSAGSPTVIFSSTGISLPATPGGTITISATSGTTLTVSSTSSTSVVLSGGISSSGGYLLGGSPGGMGAANRYMSGGGGTTMWYMNAPTGGEFRYNINESQITSINSTRLSLSQTTASTSTSTGALVVSGGVGIGGKLYAGAGTFTATGTDTGIDANSASGQNSGRFSDNTNTTLTIGHAAGQLRLSTGSTSQAMVFRLGTTEYGRFTATTGNFSLASTDVASLATSGGVTVAKQVRLAQIAGTTIDGDLWHDSTQKALQAYVDGIEQTLSGVIFTQTATRTIASSVVETSLFTTGVGTLTLPANFFLAGKTIRLNLSGTVADTGTPTVRLRLKYGSTTIIDSGAITIAALGGTEEWRAVCEITCRTAGVSGAVSGLVWFLYDTTTGANAVNGLNIAPTTATVDTTASGALDLTWEWGTSSASNTISTITATAEVLN